MPFRILIVDDDRAGAYALREVMKNLHTRPELHFVSDGLEALDFLHRRGAYADAPRPNLILLDINMPRLGGLETLSAIKSDPELYVVPVIMVTSSTSKEDMRRAYQSRANGYVQKPADLSRAVKFVQAVEAFWMDFVLLPADQRPAEDHSPSDFKRDSPTPDRPRDGADSGEPIAPAPGEERSRAVKNNSPERRIALSPKVGCEEHNRLLDDFGVAVRELLALHQQQFRAIVDGDTDCTRFDLLIHIANEKKHRAKYAYLRHVETHGCSNQNVE